MDDVEMYNFYFMECSAVETPPEGAYRVALFVSPGKFFHWYRQNPDGTWSHKLGTGFVYNCDADGDIIYDPDDANRNYFNGANFHELELDGNDIIAVKAKLLLVQTVFDILVSQEWRY